MNLREFMEQWPGEWRTLLKEASDATVASENLMRRDGYRISDADVILAFNKMEDAERHLFSALPNLKEMVISVRSSSAPNYAQEWSVDELELLEWELREKIVKDNTHYITFAGEYELGLKIKPRNINVSYWGAQLEQAIIK